MSCPHPSLILKYRRPGDEKWIVKYHADRHVDECRAEFEQKKINLIKNGYEADFAFVGCGYCIQCRLAKSRGWANRCALEATLYPKEKNYFLTLTYEDSQLSHSEKSGLPTLNFDDHRDYMKRLRRYHDYHYGNDGIRCYTAGEYGDQTARPHYHQLLFNCEIPDLKLIGHNKFGNPLYRSDSIDEIWSHGLVCIGELNWNTSAYTARYVMKKQYGKTAHLYEDAGIVAPDTRMSRKPGIAVPWFEKYGQDLYKQVGTDSEGFPIFNDSIILPSNGDQIIKFKPPRIFESHASPDVHIEQVKEMRRRVADMLDEQRRTLVMECDRDYFAGVEDSLEKSGKGMFRKFLELSS